MMAHGQLPDEARGELERDFPRYTSAGFFPYDPSDCGPSVNALIDAPHRAGIRQRRRQAPGHRQISANTRPW